MTILGISSYGHDSAAAIMVDGNLAAACEEERLSRIKHDGSFPEKAIEYCLAEAGARREDVDYVGFYHDPWLHMGRRLRHGVAHLPRSFSFLKSHSGNLRDWISMFGVARRFPRARFEYVEHHLAHAASTFYPSPFSEAAILSVDGMGEWDTTLLAHGSGARIAKLDSVPFPHSLGIYYEALTQFLGFRIHNDEYKVMGLSAYGEGRFHDAFRDLIRLGGDELFELNLEMFAHHLGRVPFYSDRFVARFGVPRRAGDALDQNHSDLASAGQAVLEETVLELVRRLYEVTGTPNLCVAGGVGLNCVANGRLLDDSPFENIYVQPASYDSGCAMGCCYHIYHNALGNQRNEPLSHFHLGPGFDNSEIEEALGERGTDYVTKDDPATECARMLSEGKVIGWFQGRMEFGPRALGARSVLADPTDSQMKNRVNRVKKRESFRPFAPSVLQESAGDYYDTSVPMPYMLFTRRVRSGVRDTVPSVTHVDGTARLQTVSREANPDFHRLIAGFKGLRGVPVVLNTSLNLKGEPMACSPHDALSIFERSELDGIFLGNYLIRRGG